ncbi:MAG: phytanoyl-CoA dioxygenase family protein [Rhodospirillaceae bacterium]|nr:phytanoyl-CoA dioxygenase family protein [Rhodospirillaceae bacterium]
MPKLLTEEQVAQYRRDGYLFPIPVMSTSEAGSYRHQLEAYEAATGGPIQSNMRHKVHLLFRWANELVRHSRVLDAVEDILGSDILCWTTNFFIKEADSPDFVSWHQDSTYWGLDPADVVTAWIALSDVPLESGAMKVLGGSHTWGQMDHHDTWHENNLLTRGQEMALENVDESKAEDIILMAGQMSLHHVCLAHGSHANTTKNRRIGLAIRYIPTYVRQLKLNDSAMLVRGADTYGHFDLEPDPADDLDAAAVAAHAEAVQRMIGAVYSGTDVDVARR